MLNTNLRYTTTMHLKQKKTFQTTTTTEVIQNKRSLVLAVGILLLLTI